MTDFRLILFNKPMDVLTRFTDEAGRSNLSQFIDVPHVYPVGRLDKNSEGLLLLTDRGSLVEPLLKPGAKEKEYLVAVEGTPTGDQIQRLADGPELKDGPTLPARVRLLEEPPSWLWPRIPPIRFRKSIPVSWMLLTIREGKNRQVRRMTAAVGLPTLRLVRTKFGSFELEQTLKSGKWRDATPAEKRDVLDLEKSKPKARHRRKRKKTR